MIDVPARFLDTLGRIAYHKITKLAVELRSPLSVTGYAQPPKIGGTGRSR